MSGVVPLESGPIILELGRTKHLGHGLEFDRGLELSSAAWPWVWLMWAPCVQGIRTCGARGQFGLAELDAKMGCGICHGVVRAVWAR